ncbi:alpha-amylase family glycosyl hydrolase [Sphaerisporangium perillae]|uniref:alpha-amylase family glycosyl hydrolase n=1 Tax=Sphaerisporangium perillae TaxID=2935860 RepID=UPI00200D82FA|nr:alpha-amylase family glycosyl hydrolase [Sphaerisporangium perillae]
MGEGGTAGGHVSDLAATVREPRWVEHVIWWQVYPLGFVGAEPATEPATETVRHRLDQIAGWLDYAVELGASGMALGPVFASGTHGYDTVDHYRIDPRLGDAGDFARLIRAAHDRGLRVLLDGVFNHVGRDFPAFRRVRELGPSAPEAHWFRLTWPEDAGPGTEPEYVTFEGHHGLVALDHAQPAVADYVTDVMSHWLAAGADGWRLDAAYAVPPRFWAEVLPRVRAKHPEAYFVGEVIHGDYRQIVLDATLDSVTQYELWKAIWSSLNDRNLFELAWALDRHNALLDTFVPLTFVGNHDVTRIASALTDPRHLPHALAVLLTVGGTPSIYYGDERAFHGVKEHRAGGDDAIRPAFPAEGPSGLAPYGRPVFRLHQDLIGLRRRHPWLHRARTRPLHLANRLLALEVTCGEHRLVTALNLDDDPAELEIPGVDRVLAGDAAVHDQGTPAARVTLPAHGWAVLADRDPLSRAG